MIKYTRTLAILCLVFLLIQSFTSVQYGLAHESLCLLGYGMNCLVMAGVFALLLVKLFSANIDLLIPREKWFTMFIGIFFLQVAFVTFAGSLIKMSLKEGPDTTSPGIYIGAISLIFLTVTWYFFRKFHQLLLKETTSALVDWSATVIKQSITLLVLSVLFVFAPQFWWTDSFAAVFLSFQIAREGWVLLRASRRADFNR